MTKNYLHQITPAKTSVVSGGQQVLPRRPNASWLSLSGPQAKHWSSFSKLGSISCDRPLQTPYKHLHDQYHVAAWYTCSISEATGHILIIQVYNLHEGPLLYIPWILKDVDRLVSTTTVLCRKVSLPHKPPVLQLFVPTSHPPPETNDLFTTSSVLPCPEFHRVL